MDESIKSIDEILALPESEYSQYIIALSKRDDAHWRLDELDDTLLGIVEKRPQDVERICGMNSKVFKKLSDSHLRVCFLGYNFNTQLIAAICRNSASDAKRTFSKGLAFCQEKKHYEAGKSISQNIFRLWKLGSMPADEALFYLMQVKEFYETLSKHEDCVEVLCAAALHFADAAAYQSAYRAIHDAQTIATGHKSLRCQARLLETQGMVALTEGDLSCAENEFKKCFQIYAHFGEAPSFELRANAALVKMSKEDYLGARKLYEQLLKDFSSDKDEPQRRHIRINLLVCYRELGDWKAAESLCLEIESDLEKCDLEARIEGKLILSKTYIATKNLAQSGRCLIGACFLIQEQIDQYQRLHYRRGVRERYIGRIKTMLADMEDSGQAENVLPILILCSSNAILDWLAVLQWCDVVSRSENIPQETKNELRNRMEDLIRFGTPFLYGPREKYDDPFEFASPKAIKRMGKEMAKTVDYSRPWREFNDITARICQNWGFDSPFEKASIINCIEKLTKRLANGSTLLFTYICEKGCEFFFIFGKEYFKATIPIESIELFIEALNKYQQSGNADRKLFASLLAKFEACLVPILAKIVSIIEINDSKSLIFVPDNLSEGFPIFSTLLASEKVRSRIKQGQFEFLTCPVLWAEHGDCRISGTSLFLSNSEEKFELVESERMAIQQAFSPKSCFYLDLNSECLDFSMQPANSVQHLHLSTHSVPARMFADPALVSTSIEMKRGSVWLDSIQRESHKLPLKLVVLNACNTGTTSNWNYYRQFITNEKVGLSSVFLLNRRSVVVATQWNEPEIAGFIFSSLFYKRLANQRHGPKAFAAAMADLFDLDVQAAIKIFQGILNEVVRERQCEAIARSSSPYPFRDAYFLGMFQCHALLFE